MTPFLADPDVTLWHGDALDVLRTLPDRSVDACVTSPPYLDARPEYPSPSLDELGSIFRELARVVSSTLLLNVGRLFRSGCEILWWADVIEQADLNGWPITDTLIWVKPNANPIHGNVLANSHEYVFLMGDGFAPDAIRTPYAPSSVPRLQRRWINGRGVKGDVRGDQHGRDVHPVGARARSFITVHVGREKGNPHPAPMALDLALHLVKLSGGKTIIDPFAGSGTTAVAARKLGRSSVLIERDDGYCQMAADRLSQLSLLAETNA